MEAGACLKVTPYTGYSVLNFGNKTVGSSVAPLLFRWSAVRNDHVHVQVQFYSLPVGGSNTTYKLRIYAHCLTCTRVRGTEQFCVWLMFNAFKGSTRACVCVCESKRVVLY